MNWKLPRPRYASRLAALLSASIILATGTSTALAQPPAMPESIQVPDGNTLFLVRHAVGTQDYVCLPSGSDVKFVLVTPRATLYDDDGQLAAMHYFSTNPVEGGAVRATWEDAADGSVVWGQAVQTSSDAGFVMPGAIGWVLLKAVGSQPGTAGDVGLAATTYVQRLNTVGGAPSTGCSSTSDVGNQAFVPYAADYLFYESAS